MTKPKFKNKYLNDFIIEKGNCFTVKPQFETKLPHPSQRVVFAIEVSKEMTSEMRDIAPDLVFETTKDKPSRLVEGAIITTSADMYGSMEKFLSFYVNTDEKIKEFWESYSSDQPAQKASNKATAAPRRRAR